MSTIEENIALLRYPVLNLFTLLTLSRIGQGLMDFRLTRQESWYLKIKENVPVDRTDHRISSVEEPTTENLDMLTSLCNSDHQE